MKEKNLVNETMEELKEEEQLNTNGGNWAYDCDVPNDKFPWNMNFSCSDGIHITNGLSGTGRCTG